MCNLIVYDIWKSIIHYGQLQYEGRCCSVVINQTYLFNIKYFRVFTNGSFLISCSGEEAEGLYQGTAANSLDTITQTVGLDVQGKSNV